MLSRQWFYPETAARATPLNDEHRYHAVVDGLLQEQRAQSSIPGEMVDFDDLVTDKECFWKALCRLYPDQEIPRFEYLTDAFRQDRDKVLARRSTQDYQDLEQIVAKVSAQESS